MNPNLGAPRPPPPNGQPPVAGQPNLVRPPPPQLRRADSRTGLIPPGQTPQQPQQQRPNGNPPQQPPSPFPQQGQRPPGPQGPPGQQAPPQFQPPRPINPNPGQQIRAPLPQQQPPLQNRPPFPANPQQLQQQRPPQIRPQGPIPTNPQQQQPPNGPPIFRAPVPQQQRPVGPPPIRQLSSEFTNDPNQLRSQNSFERLRTQQDPMAMSADPALKGISRPNSVLSNDDDDDVVIGRSSTPNNQQPIMRTPSDLARNPMQSLQRNDSKLSIPSRPQSGTDQHSKSPSPDGINKVASGYDYGKTSENLPKIPEATGRPQTYDIQRPPSVTFKDDMQRSAASPEPFKYGQSVTGSKSPASLVSGEQSERINTHTSEKFRTSPLHQRELMNHERPASLQNGSSDSRMKSSLKFSKKYYIFVN